MPRTVSRVGGTAVQASVLLALGSCASDPTMPAAPDTPATATAAAETATPDTRAPAETAAPAGLDDETGALDAPEVLPEQIRLCAWNTLKLGHNNGKDYAKVAQVLEENCERLGSMNALVPVRPNLKQSLHEFT